MMLIAGLAIPSAVAQSPGPQDTPATARDVLLLITEEVALEEGASTTVRYWWVQPDQPKWTESDAILRNALTQSGVDLVGLSSKVRISKIYRTPNLSLANAATLGSLVGAKRVLVGNITYERKKGVGALGLERVAATADVSLVSAESGETSALSRFTVEREGFAGSADEALAQARQESTDALAALVSNTLMRGPGPVGVQAEEKFIGLRNAENALVLQKVKNFLEGLDQVESVGVRWASEGVVALEVNPGKKDAEDIIEYAIRALKNQSFEEFTLAARGTPSAEGLAEFNVSAGDQGQF
jgi:hypothetical protein